MSEDIEKNPYYPYTKVLTGALTYKGAEKIPYKILTYLMDLPDANGHIPFQSNDNPRARLMRYLWNDDPFPLDGDLPTPKEKRSMLYDPRDPAGNTDAWKAAHPKGYRLLWQRNTENSQLDAQVLLKCYTARIFERKKFVSTIGIRFEIWINNNLETNTRTDAYARSFAIEQCLHEALEGVNIDGVGTISFAVFDHSDNGSEVIWDSVTNVGRAVHFSIDWAEGPESKEIELF